MIQRYLYTAIQTGINAVAADPEILDNLFQEQYDLSDTEMAAIKTSFVDDPVTVSHGYARTSDSFPRINIVLSSDSESDPYLGDDAGMVGEDDDDDDDDEEFGSEITGSMWTAAFQFQCYAGHPDIAIYLYELTKDIIFAALPYFKSVGLQKLGISGGDLALDARYVPAHLFARQVTFRCRYEFTHVDRDSRLGKAFAVAGIHIDSSGSPGRADEIGNVKTLVSPYEE